MSTIRKKPYIETILELLDSTKLNTLLTLLNSGGTSQPLTWSEEYGIYPVFFENKSGILIHTSTLSCVIFYTQYQSLILADLDYDTHNYTIINENCDINEIRRIIGDAMNSGGGSLPTGTNNGEVLIFKNNKWDIQEGYGYTITTSEPSETWDGTLAGFVYVDGWGV